MITLELFCGTKSFSKYAKKLGHKTFTIDMDSRFKPDLCIDILKFNINMLPEEFRHPDIVWASPPCTCFSVASISTHWKGGWRKYMPKTEEAKIAINLIEKTVELIEQLKPKNFFIENPRGVLRKLNLIPFNRTTVCYCQYGDRRMKPTDIWNGFLNYEGKMCHNGNKDHESAPRGAKTGTQGLKGNIERGKIPEGLFKEIFKLI